MNSCVYEGWVRHRRMSPIQNEFRYKLYQIYLDLDELEEVVRTCQRVMVLRDREKVGELEGEAIDEKTIMGMIAKTPSHQP